MLDERSAFVERKDETHDPNGFAIFSKDLLKELVRHYYLSLFTMQLSCSASKATLTLNLSQR